MDESNLRVLLIQPEKSSSNLRHLISQQNRWRCRVKEVSDYESALADLVANRFDLYFIAYQLPPHNGLQLLQQAAANGFQGPAILLCDGENVEIGEQGLQLGATDYLPAESLSQRELERAMRYALEREALRSKLQKTEEDYRAARTAEKDQRRLVGALQDVAITLNSTIDFAELLDRILINVGRVVPHDSADIMLLENDHVRIVGERGFVEQGQDSVMDIQFSITELATLRTMVQTGQPLVITDTRTDPHWTDLMHTRWIRSYLSTPIYSREKIVGFINLTSATPGFFTQTHAEELQAFAHQAGIALGNIRLIDSERRQRQLAETIYQATTAMISVIDLPGVLDTLLTQLKQVVPYHSACVFLYQNDRLHSMAGKGFADLEAVVGKDYPVDDDPIFQEILRTHQPLKISDARKDSRFKAWGNTQHIRGWLGVPLIVRQSLIGTLTLDSNQVAAYNNVDMALIQTFSNQAAIAIENARLFEHAREARQISDSLRELGTSLSSTLNFAELVERIFDGIQEVIPYTSASVQLLQNGVLRIKAARGISPDNPIWEHDFIIEEMPIAQRLFQTGEPIIVADTELDPLWNDIRSGMSIRSWLGVPLRIRNKTIGNLTLDHKEPNYYTQEHGAIAAMFAQQAAAALENARLFDETYRRAHQLAILNELASEMTGLLELEELCTTVASKLSAAFGYYNVAIFTLDEAVDELVIQVNVGMLADLAIPQQYRQPVGKGIIGKAAQTRETLIVDDTLQHPDFFELENMAVRSELAIPLKVGSQLLGVMNIDSDQPDAFDQSDVATLSTIADQLAVALEKARLFAETSQRAEQLETLRRVTQDLTLLRDIKTLLHQIAEQAIRLLRADAGSIHLYRPELEILEGTVIVGKKLSPDVLQLKPNQGLVGHVWAAREPVIINNYAQWPGHLSNWPEQIPTAAVGVPIQWGDEYLGVLAVNVNDKFRQFSTEHASLLSQFAAQVAVAVENARLFDAANRRVAELEAVREATLSLTSSLELKTVLEDILRSTLSIITRAENAHIFLYQNDQITFGAALWRDTPLDRPFSNPRPEGLTYTVARQGNPIIVPDMRSHPLYATAPSDWSGSIAGLPLKIGQQVVGVMNISGTQTNIWTESDLNILYLLADQAAVGIQNARLYEQTQEYATQLETRVAERTFELQSLYDLAQALGHATQLGDVIRLTLLHLYQTVPHDISASLLVTDTAPTLVIQSPHALSDRVETALQTMVAQKFNNSSNQKVQASQFKTHRIHSKDDDDRKLTIENLGTTLTAPIVMDNQIVGLLLVATQQEDQFNEEYKQLLTIVANQAAETIGRLQSLMAAEHKRLESVIAYLSSGVIMLDAHNYIAMANPVALEILQHLTPARVGEQPTHLGEYPISQILSKNNQEIPFTVASTRAADNIFEITAQPITAGPDVGGWILLIRDITEERAIQKRIQQQERVAAVGQLAAGIAHDFNNILTSIIGFAELLLLEPDLSAPAREDIERITKQGHRAAHLVRQILDFTRQTISSKHPLDLLPFIKETVKLLERTIPEDIHISLEIEPGQYTITADLIQIQQAVTNLALNARDAMPDGGELQFRLFQQEISEEEASHLDIAAGNWIVLAMSDTGCGIAPELTGKIFEPFFTTKEVGEGTGLGLAQVYGIMKQHEGYIDVTSQVGEGTTFTLYLPVHDWSTTAPRSETQRETPYGNNQLILLVEDNRTVRDITTSMLERLNYRVLTAVNGVEGLALYRRHKPEISLVLTDMTMPKMGGTELISALREIDIDVRIVVLTGYPLKDNVEQLLSEDIADWLQKPISIDQLAQVIHQALAEEELIN